MITPEGKLKDDVRKILREQQVYFFMPVQMGYGAAGLDFHCIVLTQPGFPMPFFIETKADGKKPTPRQDDLIERLKEKYKCKVWIISRQLHITELEIWLRTVRGV